MQFKIINQKLIIIAIFLIALTTSGCGLNKKPFNNEQTLLPQENRKPNEDKQIKLKQAETSATKESTAKITNNYKEMQILNFKDDGKLAESLQFIQYLKDDNAVYVIVKRGNDFQNGGVKAGDSGPKIIPDVDPKTVQTIQRFRENGPYQIWNYFIKDKNNVWYYNDYYKAVQKISEADPNTFEIIGLLPGKNQTYLIRDKRYVYTVNNKNKKIEPLKGVDLTNKEVIALSLYKDAGNFYYYDLYKKKLQKIAGLSFAGNPAPISLTF